MNNEIAHYCESVLVPRSVLTRNHFSTFLLVKYFDYFEELLKLILRDKIEAVDNFLIPLTVVKRQD